MEPTEVAVDTLQAAQQAAAFSQIAGAFLIVVVGGLIAVALIALFVISVRRAARKLYRFRKERQRRQVERDLLRAGVRPLKDSHHWTHHGM